MEGKDGFDVIDIANKHAIPIMILTSERRNKERIIESGALYMHKSVLGTDEFAGIFKKAVFDILASDH
jgi:DNA-binding response OmpR family regulator